MNTTHFFIQQELRRYTGQVQTWQSTVVRAPDQTAFQLAANMPVPGGVAASVKHMVRSDVFRARTEVERNLKSRIDKMTGQEPMVMTYLRQLQGHWPTLWRILNEKRQAKASSTQT